MPDAQPKPTAGCLAPSLHGRGCRCEGVIAASLAPEQPKPTAAEVIHAHARCRWNGLQRPASRMTCGGPMPAAGPDVMAQHQEDMLAAAGLLATGEHATHPLDFVRFVVPGQEQRFTTWLAQHDRDLIAATREAR